MVDARSRKKDINAKKDTSPNKEIYVYCNPRDYRIFAWQTCCTSIFESFAWRYVVWRGLPMSRRQKEKRVRIVSIGLSILVFALAFGAGVISKVAIKPSWSKEYEVKWSDKLGTLKENLSYGDGELNKFDLYLPMDDTKTSYGLVIYLHAGGFTSGDKIDDRDMLSWLCSKGYVAAGINYSLFRELNGNSNGVSVLSQSNEIKAAVPKVIEAAEASGYHIDKLAIAGGSAGHALAMIYAYRDAAEAPVPVALTFGAVGPSCFYAEDWDNYGFGRNTEESYIGAAGLFSVMADTEITPEEIKSGNYQEKVKPISAASWITPDAPPTVVAYGAYDRIQPFKASLRLRAALEANGVDYVYLELLHSGHGLQNDSAIQKQWMDAIEEYLVKYMPVK